MGNLISEVGFTLGDASASIPFLHSDVLLLARQLRYQRCPPGPLVPGADNFLRLMTDGGS